MQNTLGRFGAGRLGFGALAPIVALAITVLGISGGSLVAYVISSPARTLDAPLDVTVDDGGLAGVTDFDGGATATANALNSAEGWNGGGAGTILRATVGDVSGHSLGDGNTDVFLDDPFGICSGACLAATLTGYTTSRPDGSYRVTETDIVFNPAKAWTSSGEDGVSSGTCSGEIYVESMVVHEMGHALGLSHTSVVGATMYPSVGSCDFGPTSLAADDRSGLVALYGAAPCVDCERYERVLAPGGATLPEGTWFYLTDPATLRGWTKGTAGTNYDLELYRWTGSGWALVASSTGPTSNEEVAFTTPGAAYFYWRVVASASASSGRYFFYDTVP